MPVVFHGTPDETRQLVTAFTNNCYCNLSPHDVPCNHQWTQKEFDHLLFIKRTAESFKLAEQTI